MDPKYDCRIVVLNYNGRELLGECLPSILEAAGKSRYRVGVTVLDNESVDDSEAFVAANFKEVQYVKSGANRVFCSYNEYVKRISEEYVIFLNNDIKVAENFIDPLIDVLKKKPDAFFSAPKALNFTSGEYEGSLSKMEFRWGLLWGTAKFEGFEKKISNESITMQCGFGAFRRKEFLELGGYDDLYLPGTVEDSDLSFRAYRRGWKGYYCPDSVVYHMGQASFKKAFGVSGIRRLNRRNLYLFVWKNIKSPILIFEHILLIPVQLLKYLVSGRIDFILGFFDALRMMPRALAKRRLSLAEPSKISDEEIFAYSRGI